MSIRHFNLSRMISTHSQSNLQWLSTQSINLYIPNPLIHLIFHGIGCMSSPCKFSKHCLVKTGTKVISYKPSSPQIDSLNCHVVTLLYKLDCTNDNSSMGVLFALSWTLWLQSTIHQDTFKSSTWGCTVISTSQTKLFMLLHVHIVSIQSYERFFKLF